MDKQKKIDGKRLLYTNVLVVVVLIILSVYSWLSNRDTEAIVLAVIALPNLFYMFKIWRKLKNG